MSKTETKKLINGLIKSISTVPGLIGFANKDSVAMNPKKLEKDAHEKGIEIIETSKGYIINLNVILSVNIRMEIVARELSSSVKSFFKSIDKKIANTNIYIKGVK